MRAIATDLGTSPASLYRYVASRDELIDLMIDAAVGELELPKPLSGEWLTDLIAVARAQLALYQRHPWLIDAMPKMTSAGPHSIDFFDHCLKGLSSLDCGTASKMEAVGIMTGMVTLFARPVRAVSFDGIDPQRHPNLIAAFSSPGSPSSPDLFDRTLRSVLTGLLGQT